MEEYPTEKELKTIREWDYKQGYEELAQFVISIWHFPDWAEYRDWKKDEYGQGYRELRLATAGWSGNEDIISALFDNVMFRMLCWQSSHRGGLHIFHIIKIEKQNGQEHRKDKRQGVESLS